MKAIPILCLFLVALPCSARDTWPELSSAPKAIGGGEKDAAVIVGAEKYFIVEPVLGARQNAEDWYAYFTDALKIPAERVALLRNEEATLELIRKYAAEKAAEVRPGGTLWFVFIGHGAPSKDGKDGVLVGVDAQQRADSLYARSLSRNDLLAILASGKQARTVVLLDACFSGRTSSGLALVKGLQPLVVMAGTPAGIDNRTILLTAAKSDQFAGPLPVASTVRPAFSYLALGALRGWAADAQGNVTASSLVEFAGRALKLAKDRIQTPELAAGAGGTVLGRGWEPSPLLAKIERKGGRAVSITRASSKSKAARAGNIYGAGANWTFVKKIKWHDRAVESVSFSADSNYFLSQAHESAVVRETKDWKVLFSTTSIRGVMQLAPGGYLFGVPYDYPSRSRMTMLDLGTLAYKDWGGDGDAPQAISADGKWLAGTRRGLGYNFVGIDIFDTESKTVAIKLPAGCMTTDCGDQPIGCIHMQCDLTDAKFSYDDALLAISAITFVSQTTGKGVLDRKMIYSDSASSIRVFNTKDGTIFKESIGEFSVSKIAFSPQKNILAVNRQKKIDLWDLDEGNVEVLTSTDTGSYWGPYRGIAFSSDGNFLAFGNNNNVEIWDIKTNSPWRVLSIPPAKNNNKETIESVAFSPDGNWLAAGGSGGSVFFWQNKLIR